MSGVIFFWFFFFGLGFFCVMSFWVFILAYWFDLGGLLVNFVVLHGLAFSSTKAFLLLISGHQ